MLHHPFTTPSSRAYLTRDLLFPFPPVFAGILDPRSPFHHIVLAGILDPRSPFSISTRHLTLDARSPQLCPKPDQGDAVSSTARQALF